MARPTFVDAVAGHTAFGDPFSRPSGITTGDLLIAFLRLADTDTLTPASGWTAVSALGDGGALDWAYDVAYYRFVESGDGSSDVWTPTPSSSQIGITIGAWRGVDSIVTPSSVAVGNTSDSTIVAPSVTAATAEDLLIAYFRTFDNSTTMTVSGMTEREQLHDAGYTGGTSAFFEEALSASGATGTRTATLGTARSGRFGVLFALTPPASSSTITLTDPVAVVTGSTASCTITRNTAASGNITYNLTSSNTGIATVPATATILDGQLTGSFNITGVSAGSSTITATNAADSGETDTATANVSALKGLTVTFGQTGLTGLTFAWFDQASPDLFAAPTVVGTTESTDGSGVLEIDLTGTSVAVGNTGFLLIYKAGATAPDDIAFFGRLTVQDIG